MMNLLDNLFQNYPQLSFLKDDILKSFDMISNAFKNNGKLFLCGNGGSAADCEHIAGELMKNFNFKRALTDKQKTVFENASLSKEFYSNLQPALLAISLTDNTALSTAIINDMNPDFIFAQKLFALASKNDILLSISTSGNSSNIINAVKTAKALSVKTILLTGDTGGKLKDLCDISICVPASLTYRIQEFHLPIYHCLCAMLEKKFFF